jgi:hypothetical protein
MADTEVVCVWMRPIGNDLYCPKQLKCKTNASVLNNSYTESRILLREVDVVLQTRLSTAVWKTRPGHNSYSGIDSVNSLLTQFYVLLSEHLFLLLPFGKNHALFCQ